MKASFCASEDQLVPGLYLESQKPHTDSTDPEQMARTVLSPIRGIRFVSAESV